MNKYFRIITVVGGITLSPLSQAAGFSPWANAHGATARDAPVSERSFSTSGFAPWVNAHESAASNAPAVAVEINRAHGFTPWLKPRV